MRVEFSSFSSFRLAYSSLEKHKEAVDCFNKALELEPSNESYKTNLNLAREKLQTTGSPGPSTLRAVGERCSPFSHFFRARKAKLD